MGSSYAQSIVARRKKIALAKERGEQACHFELLLIGPVLDARNLLGLLADNPAFKEWDIEVAELDPEDAHLA